MASTGERVLSWLRMPRGKPKGSVGGNLVFTLSFSQQTLLHLKHSIWRTGKQSYKPFIIKPALASAIVIIA